MTHEELLAKINEEIKCAEFEEICGDGGWSAGAKALQAVVELHNPVEGVWVYECGHCNIWDDASEYPCATIKAIEKVLND